MDTESHWRALANPMTYIDSDQIQSLNHQRAEARLQNILLATIDQKTEEAKRVEVCREEEAIQKREEEAIQKREEEAIQKREEETRKREEIISGRLIQQEQEMEYKFQCILQEKIEIQQKIFEERLASELKAERENKHENTDVERRLRELQEKMEMLTLPKTSLLIDDLSSRTKPNTTTSQLKQTEMEFWRKKANDDEHATIRRAGVIVVLVANAIESVNNALGCKAIKTTGLSDEVEASIEAGEFDTCIKSLAITPGAIAVINNPVASFATTFGSIVLSTHMKNLKKEAANGIQSLQKDKRAPNRPNPEKKGRRSMLDTPTPPVAFGNLQEHASNFAPLVGGITKLAALA
jgi:hypothetical protein